ncbi:MAG: DMT family transporter [Deltaproteobacteria bacterium]|nr:DMT family transporter [Deltaproteobacteria bacterium]MBM4324585.1 DMT family transporter [Deltaproteobacteria bacterium]
MESKDYLDLKAILAILILTLLWGVNYSAIKISNEGISPVFASAIRSIIASICGAIYCLRKGERLFHTDIRLFHGVIVGLLFGLEFACIYFGMLYTDSARSVVFVYLSPFVVAMGAHFFLRGDRLTVLKTLGLVIAFMGILFVFYGKPKTAKPNMLIGDILEITAGVLWGATTLYIKRFMAGKVEPIHTFLYQLVFSIPILFVVSLILEPNWIYRINLPIVGSLFYQSVIVAFISYLVWFKLIHQYSVSRLSAFTFFTPIFGVLSGILFIGEEFTFSLMVGLPMVSAGIFLVNWKSR